jgi:ubiquinone/menaquinone biosynthesis C-methylase UbiE
MKDSDQIKKIVKEKYSEIALQSQEVNATSCCGSGPCCEEAYNIMSEDYSILDGYSPDADLGLGCGLPTQFAQIKKGDSVLDLGSGAGNDCFVARHEAGETGKILGVDFSEVMVTKARENAEKLGFNNVEFRMGDIENLPVSTEQIDVVVSNCVLNLVPDKQKAFGEIYRVLKAGGHFSISDVVITGELPEKLKTAAEMYVGCVSGAIAKESYLSIVKESGFIQLNIQKDKPIIVPEDILSKYLSAEEISAYKESGVTINSITLFAKKPQEKCCSGSSCC